MFRLETKKNYMAGIGHIGVGLAVKPLAPKVPLGVLLVATEVLDILWAIFYLTGIDRNASVTNTSPYLIVFLCLLFGL